MCVICGLLSILQYQHGYGIDASTSVCGVRGRLGSGGKQKERLIDASRQIPATFASLAHDWDEITTFVRRAWMDGCVSDGGAIMAVVCLLCRTIMYQYYEGHCGNEVYLVVSREDRHATQSGGGDGFHGCRNLAGWRAPGGRSVMAVRMYV